MDFGRVKEHGLSAINFKLPEDPQWNRNILKGENAGPPKVYLGCPRWGAKEWLGKIYPNGTKDGQFLASYIKQYNAVELNATHHQLYYAAVIKKWSAPAAETDFKFCPKIFKGISHSGLLTGNLDVTNEFLKSIRAFEQHLGPVFIQLSDYFSAARKAELFQYLGFLPTDVSFFVELRHASWFESPHLEELLKTLQQLNIGIVITDTAGRRDCCHMHLTQAKTFIRFVANHHKTDFTRIDDWADRIGYWLGHGLSELYFFLHVYNEAFSPELTIYAVEKLNKTCGLNLKKPVLVQPSLFD